jgi:hypothetical protein
MTDETTGGHVLKFFLKKSFIKKFGCDIIAAEVKDQG